MSTDRYVVAGLAHVRSAWFTEVSRWATMGTLPLEFVKCVSPTELKARIDSGRPFSAALLDARLPSVDRDLLHVLAQRQVTVIVVEEPSSRVEWTDLGASATLGPGFDQGHLLAALAEHATPIGSIDAPIEPPPEATDAPATAHGRLLAVTGRSGAGTSTTASALAQALAADHDVILADFALNAHQAILHDAGDVVPGIQELTDSHRSGQPSREAIRDLTFAVPSRNYQLLLGLRRHRDWSTLRPRALRAAILSLRGAADIVVADVTGDVEGEAETGSFDVEERNQLARMTVTSADLVFLVAQPTLTGLHGLAVQIDELMAVGVAQHRMVPVINRAPVRPNRRAQVAKTIAGITRAAPDGSGFLGPIFLPARRGVDHHHRTVSRFPPALEDPLRTNAERFLAHVGANERVAAVGEPIPVAPGELGTWADHEADDLT